MPKVSDVCRHVRSKNAGPFWTTIDLFFNSRENFEKYALCKALNADAFGKLYGTDPKLVRHIPAENLHMVKISYARPKPQGWMGERDMHQGQSFARLLPVELGD